MLAKTLQRHDTGETQVQLFCCNSGTESVEAALKLAKAYQSPRGGYLYAPPAAHFAANHWGALTPRPNPPSRRPFMPLLPGFRHVPFGGLRRDEHGI